MLTSTWNDASDVLTVSAVCRRHMLPQGAELQPDGSVSFKLWAPAAKTIHLEVEGMERVLQFERQEDGWHALVSSEVGPGSRYRYVLPDGMRVPDQASRFQPADIHGPSEVIDPEEYAWSDAEWHGRDWSEAVVYEVHIGTFTPEGTFRAAINKLDHLVNLGVTAIEIMPIADFPGNRNWGYDGVLLYAPDSSYGRPEDFKVLIDAAHAKGIMIILDVVYNHFGPDGNYQPIYAPNMLTSHHKTSWGDAVNYDSQGSKVVREFVIHNALYWIEEFHLDGLRLDAVHAIKDDSQKHLLDELAERVREATKGRSVHLILENEKNQAFRLVRDERGQPVHYTAQWNDDMHHVLHTAATLESNGYYGDFKDDTEKLGRALAEGFAFQGEVMTATGAERGEPCGHLPPSAFIAFMQNHDQIGNRAFGERINAIASPEAVHAIASIYLLLPQTPMLFMGEEWGSSQPFPFFCDFQGELAEKIREGRREEFSSFPEFKDPQKRDRIPDPLAAQTFLSAKLDWQQAFAGVHAEWYDWYKRILAVRRNMLPTFKQIGGNAGSYKVIDTGAVIVRWQAAEYNYVLMANLSDRTTDGFEFSSNPMSELIWHEGPPWLATIMRPWSVRWLLQAEGRE